MFGRLSIVSFFVWSQAGLLLLAALLKGVALLTNPFVDLQLGYPASILLLAVLVEGVAAGYLFFGRDMTRKCLVLFFLHALFLAIAMIRSSKGMVGCGCLGAFEPPSWVLPLNSSLVLLVLSGAYAFSVWQGDQPDLGAALTEVYARLCQPTHAGRAAAVLCVVFVLLFFPAVENHPSLSLLYDQPPIPAVRFVAGDLPVGEPTELEVPFRNETDCGNGRLIV